MLPVWGVAIVLIDLALLAWAVRRPMSALRLLLILLPVHSAAYLLASNVLLIDPTLVSLGGAWKEALIAGLLLVALRRWWSTRGRPDLLSVLALVMLAIIAARGILDIATGADVVLVAFGARQLAEWIVLFMVVRALRPSVEWFLGTARLALPIVAFTAAFGIGQPILGTGFYDHFFHAPGELLHHSYLADTGHAIRLRAVGASIAPNEFGLGLVIFTYVFTVPLLAAVRHRAQVVAASVVIGLAFGALLLSFSRSAWLGAAMGAVAVLAVFRWPLRRMWEGRSILRVPWTRLALGAAGIVAVAVLYFVVIGGPEVVAFTLSGHEASAAGRGASLATGVGTTVSNFGGLGLGTAGPTALARAGRAVLTENWYLVYGIQLGVAPGAILILLVLGALWRVARAVADIASRTARRLVDDHPHYPLWVGLGATAALIAALVGALVIPALLDLPDSLILWAAVATVLGWRAAEPATGRAVASRGPVAG